MVEGEVVKVDKAAGKVTLKHGPIKKFDMDSMTMVFRVADPAMLDKLKVGGRIEFEADRVNGATTVTKIGKSHRVAYAHQNRTAVRHEPKRWPGLFGQELALDKWNLCRLV